MKYLLTLLLLTGCASAPNNEKCFLVKITDNSVIDNQEDNDCQLYYWKKHEKLKQRQKLGK